MIAKLAWMSLAPLFERFRRGEGGLLAVNAALVIAARPTPGSGAAQLLLAAGVLAAVYAVNDWRDAEDDQSNPKKNQRLVKALLEWRGGFAAWLWALQIGLVLFAWGVLGPRTALAAATMMVVNAVYSWWLKGVPVLDLVIVSVWGAAYAAIVSPHWRLAAIVGLMTSIMHVFQIQQDRDVDAANAVATTAVRLPWAGSLAVGALCAGLAVALLGAFGTLGALSAFVPLALRVALADTRRAWMASRIYCGLALLAALGASHGPP